ncbi:hypothetical protein BSU04_15145 [Caballeronia sordidicola]|uniref:Uncharacterized protein n=1 Tax=Caballeronia sordidicola TaxID=196367 RepID=A0A226X309_CABSO|nr:hypothetical protein BSU04_15145 [Caballeronia sordidicola]
MRRWPSGFAKYATPVGLASLEAGIWAEWKRSFLIVRTATLSMVRTLIGSIKLDQARSSSIKLNCSTLAQRVLFELAMLAMVSGMSGR